MKARMAEYEGFVTSVKRSEAGKLIPDEGESARGVALRVSLAGKRVGKAVAAWVVDGVVYFRLV